MTDIGQNPADNSLPEERDEHFGVLPSFFWSAPAAEGLTKKLWILAKSAYLESLLPSLLKERLFDALTIMFLAPTNSVRALVEEQHCAFDGVTVGAESLACGLATHTGEPVLTTDVRSAPSWAVGGLCPLNGIHCAVSFPASANSTGAEKHG